MQHWAPRSGRTVLNEGELRQIGFIDSMRQEPLRIRRPQSDGRGPPLIAHCGQRGLRLLAIGPMLRAIRRQRPDDCCRQVLEPEIVVTNETSVSTIWRIQRGRALGGEDRRYLA